MGVGPRTKDPSVEKRQIRNECKGWDLNVTTHPPEQYGGMGDDIREVDLAWDKADKLV